MGIQTQIYRLLAGNVMRDKPVVLSPGTPCRALVRAMAEQGASCAFVVDGAGAVLGILTERDVTQRITFRADPDTPVDSLMTSPVRTIGEGEYLYRAIAMMRRQGVRHMPVVDRAGHIAGVLDLHDAVAVATERLMRQIDRLTVEGTIDGLRAVKTAQVQLAQELFDESVAAPEIQQLLTDINRDIYRRVVRGTLAGMEADGWGPPPVDFDLLVMGSGGRGENFLLPDQDNGLILADYPDSEHTAIDGFFIEFSERMTRDMDAVGFPYCKGAVMATNPLWRKSLGQWIDQTASWGRKRNFMVARLVGIFFDFCAAYGTTEMTRKLRQHVTVTMGQSPGFLRELYKDEADHGTALGWFSRLVVERTDRDKRGHINLKIHGHLPLVEMTRLLALREGISDTRTLARIEELTVKGALSRDQRDYLVSAFTHLTTLRLRQQIQDYMAGQPVSNHVRPDDLTRYERELLVESFRTIEDLRNKVRAEFTADLF